MLISAPSPISATTEAGCDKRDRQSLPPAGASIQPVKPVAVVRAAPVRNLVAPVTGAAVYLTRHQANSVTKLAIT